VARGLTAGAFFLGCVDRSGQILSVDETATATGRAGQSVLNLVITAEHPAVTGLLADRSWRGVRVLQITVPGFAGPTVLIAAAVGRVVDVAMLMLYPKEDLLLSRDFQQLFEAADQGVWAFARDRTPLFTNARMARMAHCGPQDLLLHPADFLPPQGFADGVTLRRANGEPMLAKTTTIPIATADGDPLATVLLVDETETPSTNVRLARTRLHDPLTGLPNRTYLAHRLAQEQNQSRSGNGRGYGIVLCNLRGFGMFNRQYGEARGDQLLGAVADRLRLLIPPPHFLARLNKDEFVVTCPGLPSVDTARDIAERLRKAFTALVTFDDIDYQARLSCGIAFRKDGQSEDLDTLVAEASRQAH
jgi:diguanylate cyclase (GGDEF)-like protein